MSELLIQNAEIITSERVIANGWLLARGGKIIAYGEGEVRSGAAQVLDAGGRTLLPGFIDVHVHGAMGGDTMDAASDSLRKMAAYYASQGVTAFLPTTLTAPHEQLLDALATVRSLMHQPLEDGATIIGSHLEGPYFNVEKCGAQNPDYVRRATLDEALYYLDSGVLRLISLAPEFAENLPVISEAVRRGITVSIAHTDATYEQALAAIDLGISHATHTYNAMSGLHHRKPGTLGAVLGSTKVRCELIADNIHVHPGAMNVVWQTKGKDRTILITDAMSAAGMPEGQYKLGDLAVTVKDGQATLASGTLAGSVLGMATGVRNFLAATGTTLADMWQTMSLNPARACGVAHTKGSIEVGKDADFALVDERVQVAMTIIGGRIVYRAS
jgi:N-acetylglucosamine-6-phosphate deacetylase